MFCPHTFLSISYHKSFPLSHRNPLVLDTFPTISFTLGHVMGRIQTAFVVLHIFICHLSPALIFFFLQLGKSQNMSKKNSRNSYFCDRNTLRTYSGHNLKFGISKIRGEKKPPPQTNNNSNRKKLMKKEILKGQNLAS